MRIPHRATLLPLIVGWGGVHATACTSSSSMPDTPHIDFVSDTYMLQPGEEKYFCYATNLPADRDIAIVKLSPTYGAGTHHILVSQTLAPEPAFSECPVLSKSTWAPIYAGGKGSSPLVLPDNTGFVPLVRGQQVVMQLHLQNATDAPISAKTAMRVDFVDATPDLVRAGFVGFDNRTLDIPAHSDAAMNQMSCTIPQEIDVFAALGHMHKHGLHIDVSRGATAGAEMLFAEDWNFDAQPIAPVSFKLMPNDNMFLRCSYRNDGDTALVYGESSDTEMCVLVLYYAPATTARGCVQK
jgi:Copper type II ascorbate-dependent monooxygenase, C-terminal domain